MKKNMNVKSVNTRSRISEIGINIVPLVSMGGTIQKKTFLNRRDKMEEECDYVCLNCGERFKKEDMQNKSCPGCDISILTGSIRTKSFFDKEGGITDEGLN